MNTIHHGDWMTNTLPDGCAKLIIADPPYYKVKGGFDFIWRDFDHYLENVNIWAQECSRILADDGSLFWWGDARKIAYSQVILDRHFNLLNNLVWEKIDSQNRRNEIKAQRRFAPVTERLLFYCKGDDKSELQELADNPEMFAPIKVWLDQEHEATGIPLKEMCQRFGSSCSHYFGFSTKVKTQFMIPTPEIYKKLQSTGRFAMPYEELRSWFDLEFERNKPKRRTFELPGKLITDILLYSQESNVTGNYDHDTVKPETLTRMLITVTTKPGDLVVVPFAGSGTECAMAAAEGRNFIGWDTDQKHVKTATDRVNTVLSVPKLFNL